jgi:hypothetical protein
MEKGIGGRCEFSALAKINAETTTIDTRIDILTCVALNSEVGKRLVKPGHPTLGHGM